MKGDIITTCLILILYFLKTPCYLGIFGYEVMANSGFFSQCSMAESKLCRLEKQQTSL